MTFNFKKTLLAGTALVAVGAFGAQAQAAVVAQTLTGNVTWAVDANSNQSPADGTGAAASDTVDLATFTLSVLNTTANDGGGVGTYTLGAVTGTTGDLLITSDAANVDMTVTVASMTTTSTGDLTVRTLDADNSTIAATVTGVSTIGGALSVTSTEADAADTVTLTLTGSATVTGTTTLTAGGAVSGANATLNVDGAANTFTGAVTVSGGGHAAADAYITLSGASTTFTGGLVLDDTTGQAILTVDGATAQTIAGAITGGTDGDGYVLVTNTSGGVTFTGTVGTASNSLASVTVAAADGNNTSATFKAGVDVTAIVLGNGTGTDTNTVTFDGTTAGFTVAGTVNGTAGDTDNVVVSGGNTITTSGVWGGGTTLQSVEVSGSGTILSAGASMTSAAFTVGSGATLQTSGAATLTGTINGAGTLDVNAATTVAGVIGGTTALTSIDVAAGITLTLNGTTTAATATTTTLSGLGTGTLAFTGGNTSQTMTTNIETATDDAGAITIADGTGTTAFVGNIGTSTKQLATLAVAGGGNNTVTTTGNLYINAITIDDADVLQFLGTSAQAVSGTINGVGSGDGVITVGNGTTASSVTFSGIIGATQGIGSGTTSAAATAIYDANATYTGTYTTTGTTQVNSGATLTVGTTAGTGTYNIGVDRTAGTQTYGKIVETGDTDLSSNTVHFIVEANSQPLTLGASVLDAVFNDNNTDAVITGATVTDNSYLYAFTLVSDTANDEVDVTVALAQSTATSGTTVGNRNVLDTLITNLASSTNTQINQIQGNVQAATTQAALNEVLEAAGPTVDGGATVAGFQASNAAINVNSERLAALRTGETGVASGNMGNGITAWMQGFGKTATQDRRDAIDGYDADTFGAAVGVDTENLNEATVLGVSVSYANTNVDSNNATTTSSDIDSYQISLYGDYDIDAATYVSGNIGYAWNNIDQTRHNVGGVTGLTALADYDSQQFLANVKAGRDYQMGGAVVTPNVGVNYQNISTDSYTETGASGANLNVDSDSLNVLEVGVGAEAKWDVKQSDGSSLVPAVHAGLRHDLIGDNVETSSTFTGGGAAFKSQGADPAQTTFDVGASLSLYTVNNWSLTGNYDYEVKSDYDAHAGYVRAGYKF